MAGWVASTLAPKAETGFKASEFGDCRLLLGGRIQPFDSVARQCTAPNPRQTNGGVLGREKVLASSARRNGFGTDDEAGRRRTSERLSAWTNLELLDLLKLPRMKSTFL